MGQFNWWVDDVLGHRPEGTNHDDWWRDLHAVGASDMLKHDLLATTSRPLVSVRDKPHIVEVNVCSIRETLRIVGLFMRSRECFAYAAGQVTLLIDGWSFYGRMTKAQLPRVWFRGKRWFDIRESKISQLRGSVIGRCRRAIEARDAIGVQFYLRNDHRAEETAQYHFDYLTLLLSGALDAVMHIANAVYEINEDDWNVGLWRKEFRKVMKQRAPAIAELLGRRDAKALRHLLAAPRNTIHSEQLRSITFSHQDSPSIGLITLGQEIGHRALDASRDVGGPGRWGIVEYPEIPIEPYAYSTALIETCFPLLCDLLELVEGQLFGAALGADAMVDPEPDQLRRIELLS
jgi:hypothetical protein